MDVLALFLSGFQEFSVGHIALAIYLYVIMDERGCRMLKKLPALAFSPALASMIHLSLYNVFKVSGLVLYVVISVANVLMCTLWVRWGWRIGIWRALAAVCMAGCFRWQRLFCPRDCSACRLRMKIYNSPGSSSMSRSWKLFGGRPGPSGTTIKIYLPGCPLRPGRGNWMRC